MKLFVKDLGIETTLEQFVKDWDLDIYSVNEELEGDLETYFGEFCSIEKDEENENCLMGNINTESWEVMDMVNDIYDDYYLFVVKDVFYGENDEVCEVCDGEGVDANDEDCKSCDGEGGDYEEINYTQFSIENSTSNNDVVFKGGQYQEKSILNENELSKFYDQCNEGKTENDVKYQDIWFVKEEDFNKNGWKKTIESFNLYDWNKYNF